MALSPISPPELLLQPMTHRTDSSEDYDASQVPKQGLLPIEIVDREKKYILLTWFLDLKTQYIFRRLAIKIVKTNNFMEYIL